tara:strand:- start:839 stop:1243 length:405 start_codon:yes stop_codon:yes gene_type:complete
LITDILKDKLASYLVELVNHANAEGDVGLGGNSTSPVATSLDVPLGITTSSYVANKTIENVVEISMVVAGSNIAGKVIREASFGGNEGNFVSSTDSTATLSGTADKMLARVTFDGVGPLASNEQLEIFLTVEVE